MNVEGMPLAWCEACRQECPLGCCGPMNTAPAAVRECAARLTGQSRKISQMIYEEKPFAELEPEMRALYDLAVEHGMRMPYQAFVQSVILKSTRFREICGAPAVQMRTGIAFVDEKEEHTPTAPEWKVLAKKKVFKSFVSRIGGLEKPRLVKCGEGSILNNMEDAKAMVERNPNLTLKCGWFILVGTPTLFNFNPHWWVEDESGKSIAVSGESGETHLLLAEPKEDFSKLLFSSMTASSQICKSICRVPVLNGQQTIDNFVETAGQDRHVLRIPVHPRLAHLYATDSEEKSED